jgi:8-oxo-dGTP pyrophosphatase MutT (NUDIX family)
MWPVTSSRIAYENSWIKVVEDQVVGPDGTPGVYGVVEVRHPAVFIVAVNDAGEVLFESVDRHTVGPSLEIPAGGSDGEDLLVAAQRELYEETGYVADHWRAIGSMWALNGVCRASEHVFLAQGLSRSTDGADATAEGISGVRWIPWAEVLRMVASGRIDDGETVASLMYAAIALNRFSAAAPVAVEQPLASHP